MIPEVNILKSCALQFETLVKNTLPLFGILDNSFPEKYFVIYVNAIRIKMKKSVLYAIRKTVIHQSTFVCLISALHGEKSHPSSRACDR